MSDHPSEPTTRPTPTSTASTTDSTEKSPQSPNQEDALDKQGRKRMRVPTSCSVCRKRKIKCDKIRPICGGCSKSHVGHLCHYEEPVWVNSKDLWKHAKPINSLAADSSTALPPAATTATAVSNGSFVGVSPPVNGIQPPTSNSKQALDELAARVKHIEASITVSHMAASGESYAAPSVYDQQQQQQYSSNGGHFARPQQQASSEFIGSTAQHPGPAYDFDPDQTLDFFDFLPFIIKKSRLEYHGGLDPKSIVKKDPHLKIVWIHLWKNFEKSLQSSIEKSDNGVTNPSTHGFHEFLEMRKKKRSIKKETMDAIASEESLESLILRYLPSKKAIMTLCFRFFKYVYPVLPFINENSFLQELESILGSWAPMDDRPTKINITSKYDYATLALLFLVMRFAQLSIEGHEYETRQELACLKDVSIHAGHVIISMQCLKQYNFIRKAYSLRVLQVMLYNKLYYRYCPEDDDISDGSEGTIMTGTIYSVALALGLQTDPEELVGLIKSPNTQSYGQLWRKIWYKILEMDATESVSLGIIANCPNDLSYDTKLPTVEPGMDEVDTFVMKDFEFMEKKTVLYRKISNLLFNRRKKPTTLQLIQIIREIENFMGVHFGSLKEILSDQSMKSYAKVKKVTYLYELNSTLLSLKARLLVHFYDVGNTKKVFEIFDESLTLTMKILNSSLNLYFNMSRYFEPGYRILMRPIAYIAISKAMLMIASLLAKLSQCQRLVPASDITRTKLIKEFYGSLLSNMDVAVQLMSAVCSGYYNVQRIVLVFKLFYQKLKDPSFDFDAVALDATKPRWDPTAPSGGANLAHDIHAVTTDDIPKSNLLMNLLDTELAYLKAKTENNLAEVLQPLVNMNISSNTPGVNPSGTGNGQFYDPTVDGLTVRTPLSTAGPSSATLAAPTVGTPSLSGNGALIDSLNLSSIFGKQTADSPYDPNVLSSEEFASLFGLFEDYNFINLDQRGLKGL